MKTLSVILVAALLGMLTFACGGARTGGNNSQNTAAQNTANIGNHDMSNLTNHDMSNMSDHDMSKMDEMRSAPDADKQPYDLQLIDTMTFHHQGVLKMTRMALGKTQRAEVKTFAQKIITDQAKEIGQLRKWRDDWYAGKPSALNMDMPGMMNKE